MEGFLTVSEELAEFLLRVGYAQQLLIFLKYRIELSLGELAGLNDPLEIP